MAHSINCNCIFLLTFLLTKIGDKITKMLVNIVDHDIVPKYGILSNYRTCLKISTL